MAIIFSISKDYSVNFANKDVYNIVGHAISETFKGDKSNNFIFKSLKGEKFLIRTDMYTFYELGDKIKISGKAQTPQNFKSENGIIFNYQKFLSKDKIYYTIFFPHIELINKQDKKNLFYYLFIFKKSFVIQSQKIFSLQTSSLVLGILLGSKDSIDSDLENSFRRSGLIHILVLSGFNLSIIAYFIFRIFSFSHRTIRYLFSLFFIILFVLIVGLSSTVIRASIMICLFIFSKFFRRNSDVFNAILVAASIMIFINPIILIYDPSFQLSFVATLGLVSFSRYIDNMLYFLTSKFLIKEIIVSNVAVQITIIPLLIYLMGEFSIISIVPNILILPIIPFLMLVSFVSLSLSFCSSFLSFPFVFITEKIAVFVIYSVKFFGNLNYAIVKIQMKSIQTLIVIFVIFFVLIICLKTREKFIEKQKYSYLQF